MTGPLWHFTCHHSYEHIGRRGVLQPHQHVLMPELPPAVWLTDDPTPTRHDVGLTSTHLRCDRMAYRYRALCDEAEPYLDHRALISPAVRADLERYGRPETWWLSFEPTAAVLA